MSLMSLTAVSLGKKVQAWEVIFLRFPLKHGRCRMKIVDVIPSATTI